MYPKMYLLYTADNTRSPLGMVNKHSKIWFLDVMSTLSPYNTSLVLLVNHYCTENSRTKHKLAVALWECIKSRNLSLNQLIATLNNLDDTKLGDEFLEYLQKSFNPASIDVLKKLLGNGGTIQALMYGHAELVEPASPFGLFLRHMVVSYEIASFEKISAFIADMTTYTQNKDTICPILSLKQQQAFFCREVVKFQSQLSLPHSNAELHEKCVAMCNDNKIQQAEFLKYLNFLSVKEYNLAKKHLLQYFTMMLNCSDESKNIRPFSALNLAAMYSVFQHKELALQYLKESIHLGQLLGEESCLAHCIALMSYIQGTPLTTPLLDLENSPTQLEMLGHGLCLKKQCSNGTDSDSVLKSLCSLAHLSPQHNTNAAQIFRWYGNSLLYELHSFFTLLQICPDWLKDGHMISFSSAASGLCIALCNLALSLAQSDAPSVVAIELLTFTKSLFPPFSDHQNLIIITLNKIKFHSSKISNKPTLSEESIIGTISKRTLETLTSTDDVDEGSDMYMTSSEYRACVLYNAAETDLPDSPAQAVETILELILHCKSYNLMEYLLKAHLLLTRTQILLHLFDQAARTIESVFIQALASNTSYIQCSARWLYCQVRLALAEPDDRYNTFVTLQHHLKLALDGFIAQSHTQCVCDILYYLARLYDMFGMKDDRNKCAKQFRNYYT